MLKSHDEIVKKLLIATDYILSNPEQGTGDTQEDLRRAYTVILEQRDAEVREMVEGNIEKWAEFEHIRWAKWQNYLHSHLTWNNDIQAWVLPHEWKDRWQMQINTPYQNLTEKEKDSDREQVRPYIKSLLTQLNNNK